MMASTHETREFGNAPAARSGRISAYIATVRWPEVGLILVVALVGLYETVTADVWPTMRLVMATVALGTTVAVGLSRRQPGVALALLWITCAFQLLAGGNLMLVQLAVAVVAFAAARWGSTATVWFSLVSIPVAAVIFVWILSVGGLNHLLGWFGDRRLLDAFGPNSLWQALAIGMIFFAVLLGIPWLVGLALRFGARASESRASQAAAEEDAALAAVESAQAREIARLRDEQARLARDVHDVVGHSLAVILAQAESAQFIDDSDGQRLKETMATIATSARESLQDVRQVLAETQQTASGAGDFDTLIDGLRTSGHEVVTSDVGTAQPLPPELAEVAYRVLQEMLTNAIKHGHRGSPVYVERHWEGELRIEVRNVVGEVTDGGDRINGGQGLDGMRRRLESVGGRLDVRRRDEAVGPTFTATAWMPVRARW